MKDTSPKNRIMQVSELIANNILESALDFQHNTTQSKFLWEAVEILAPELEELDKALEAAAVGVAVDIHQLRNLETNTTYVIGVLMGLHLRLLSDLMAVDE